MPLSTDIAKREAEAIASVSEAAAAVLQIIDQALEHNSDLAIDWAAAELPAYIAEDGNGNITGLTYSRAEVANAIGSLDQIRRLLTNQTTSQGDHLGNLNKLARPQVTRIRLDQR